jgi:hypothetical protein
MGAIPLGVAVIDQEMHDGFEGVGLLVELFLGIAVLAIVLPVITAIRKLVVDASREPAARGFFVWISTAVYLISVLLFWEFNGISLTDDVRRIAIWACIGSTVAIGCFILGFFARGPGRIPSIVQGIYSMVVWLPFFEGRVILHLHDCGMPLAKCR